MVKAYIIRLSDNDLSVKLAYESFQAAVDVGYDVEYFEGVRKRQDISCVLQENNIVANHAGGDIKTNWGTLGCFVSHFLLWNKAREDNQRFVVLEHDGIAVRNCEEIIDDVKHACHLDRYLPLTTDKHKPNYFQHYDESVKQDFDPQVEKYFYSKGFYGNNEVTGSFFRGAYGYIITPEGGDRLIQFVKQFGAFPADMCLCENAVNIQGTTGTYVRLNTFFHNIDNQRQYTTRF